MAAYNTEKKYYQIGELAKKLKISSRTIRYYEEIGLIKEAKRMSGSYRVYDEEDYIRLKFINKLKLLGLKLSQILELEKLYREGKLHPLDLKLAVAEYLDKLIAPIREHFEKDKKARELYEFMKSVQITR